MKRIQLAISKVFVIEVEDDMTEIGDMHNALLDKIQRNNETVETIFFENLTIVCSECGISLNLPEEQEDNKCVQCANDISPNQWRTD